MLDQLGARGRLLTMTAIAVAVIAAGYAAVESEWTTAVSLLLTAYLSLLVAIVWGVTRSTLRLTREVAIRQRRIRAKQSAQIRLVHAKIERTRSQVARLGAFRKAPVPAPTANHSSAPKPLTPDESQGKHSVERRYAGLLDQPMSVPNSNLLSYLEILAKDATSRRAEDAILRQAVGELRELVETQQAEIVMLHQRVGGRDAASMRSPRSSV